MRGRVQILRAQSRGQGQFGNPMGDDIKIHHFLDIAGEQLKAARARDGVIFIVAAMQAARLSGQCPGGKIDNTTQAAAGHVMQFFQQTAQAVGDQRTAQAGQRGPGGQRRQFPRHL